jgi:hypothetical protein
MTSLLPLLFCLSSATLAISGIEHFPDCYFTSPIGSHEKRITVCLQFNVTSRERNQRGLPECTRKGQEAVRVGCQQAQRTLYPFLCRISQPQFAPENTQKIRPKPFHRAYYVQNLVDGTGTERDPRNTHLPATPAKTAGLSNSDLSWHFHVAADGRWTRQMAVTKKAAYPDNNAGPIQMLRLPRATPSITKTLLILTRSNCDLARA